MKTWKNVKDKIHERLLSSEWHAGELRQLVKKNAVADIWRTWYADFGDLLGMQCIVSITYKHLKIWGVTPDDLEEAARANDAGNYKVCYMGEIAGLMAAPPESNAAVYSVSNEGGFFGAAAVMKKDVQAELAGLFPSGYYILPVTVGECIAVSGEMDADELARMVFQISRADLQDEDRLSDHVFRIENGDLVVVA